MTVLFFSILGHDTETKIIYRRRLLPLQQPQIWFVFGSTDLDSSAWSETKLKASFLLPLNEAAPPDCTKVRVERGSQFQYFQFQNLSSTLSLWLNLSAKVGTFLIFIKQVKGFALTGVGSDIYSQMSTKTDEKLHS